jgi:predicted metalloendopeptidase
MRRPCLLPLIALVLAGAPAFAQIEYKGFNPKFIDTATAPSKDFFQHALGQWLDHTPIPAEYSRYGVDEEVEVRTFAVLKDILETAARDTAAPKGSDRQKVGAFYAAGMDTAAIEAAGVKPLAKDFQSIQAIHDGPSLARELARLQRRGSRPALDFGVGQDDKDSIHNIATLSQGGLGLPERDYYLLDDAKSKDLRVRYQAHVARMFGLLGEGPALAKTHAATVLAMETRLAKASMTRVEMRDPNAIYHKMTRQQFAAATKGLPWDAFFGELGVPASEALLVRTPAFFTELGAMAATVPLKDWKVYLRWHLINDTASVLSRPFEQAHFEFHQKTLQGIQEERPRWKRILNSTDLAMGEILGKLYVERAFPPKAKAQMLELVQNLRLALGDRIQQLEWMTAPTKKLAQAKLDTIAVKIGYPDVWRDYRALAIERRPHVLNVLAGRTFEFNRNLAKLGKPIDRNEWRMTPATNNAYYDPTMNEICFPAGILQPPYFDLTADDAVNYGNIGATIGHEMTHGFDDEGRQYDAQGNLKDWWTEADAKAYDQRAALIVKQFDAFEPLPGMHINGKATLGENIADLGGLKIALEAYRKSQQGKAPVGLIEGYTPEQRFFLGYAETWRNKLRDEALRNRLMTDPHAPSKYRVNGPLSNMPEFFEAFGIKEGEPMRRPEAERPAIW